MRGERRGGTTGTTVIERFYDSVESLARPSRELGAAVLLTLTIRYNYNFIRKS